ncbi:MULTISPECIES: hypothetical protein [unclassified Moraxella]|uniref:hypothetical protein n=1 Tax=unclassified Moraxella TaxID=2685852 RepID=UPI003AF9F2DB
MKVIIGDDFALKLVNFPNTDKQKIRLFILHLEKHGFDGLTGRNKSSDNVPFNDPNWSDKVAYAQKYQLWHYHIGIPNYTMTNNGEQISEYIIHYIKESDKIILISMSYHPPFELPDESILSYQD